MWTVVYIAPSRSVADSMKEFLEKQGYLATIRPVGISHGSACNFEILVPESEAEDAQAALSEEFDK
ncbi:MAG TPA: glutamate decarboxylase [Firmicutes bacterium]|nr:glutamate decarboxylase [Bacillota bacterium]HHY98003.1 glutamate decarboxylase [Bacillota bacterium]